MSASSDTRQIVDPMMWQEPDNGEFAHIGTMEDLDPQDVFYHPPITNEDELALWMSIAEVQVNTQKIEIESSVSARVSLQSRSSTIEITET